MAGIEYVEFAETPKHVKAVEQQIAAHAHMAGPSLKFVYEQECCSVQVQEDGGKEWEGGGGGGGRGGPISCQRH